MKSHGTLRHVLEFQGRSVRRADGLTRFVEAYRSQARLPEPVLAQVSLGALLDEVGRNFRGRWASCGVCLRLVKPGPDIVLELDLDLMVRALANILSHGAEAALSAGRAAPTVTLAAEIREGATRLTIEDNGPGLRPADQETIFRPFFTTKPQGSGVGLSFARQVALSHGGSLTLAVPRAGPRRAVCAGAVDYDAFFSSISRLGAPGVSTAGAGQ